MKYKIKNCRGVYYNGEYCGDSGVECKDCIDCLLKQIVEMCKKAQKTQWVNNKKKPYSPSKASFARDILKLLEIEEANE